MLNKIMIVLLVVIMAGSGVTGYYVYQQHQYIDSLTKQLAVSQQENTAQVETIKNNMDAQLTSVDDEISSLKADNAAGLADFKKQEETDKLSLGAQIDDTSTRISTLKGKIDTDLNSVSAQINDITPGLAADKIFNKVNPSIVQITDGTFTYGAGFLFDPNGHVVTAAHVIEDISNISVILSDGTVSTATIVGKALRSDVVVLKLDVTTSLPPVTLAGSSSVTPGDAVIAVGHPFDLTNSLTVGVVSQIHRFEDIGGDSEEWLADLIQFDAAVNPGNSGGPLFDENGNVVGMVVATVNPIFGSGVGFAISTARIRMATNNLIFNGKSLYPFIGIYVNYLTPDYAASLGLKSCNGALVLNVVGGFAAYQAGIKNGDIITGIGSIAINCPEDVYSYFGSQPVWGIPLVVHIIRGGQNLSFNVTAGSVSEDYRWVWGEIDYWTQTIKIPGIYT
jgi:S1-C subfamily serine protease